jgi:hypothetical protein
VPFVPGECGNPNGRPRIQPGEKRKIVKKINIEITYDENGRVDADAYLQAIIKHPDVELRTKVGAAMVLHKQLWVTEVLDLPPASNVEESTANIARIAALGRQRKLPLDVVRELISHEQAYIEAKTSTDVEAQMLEIRRELEQLRASSTNTTTETVIIGGMESLPGTNIIMPKFRIEHDVPMPEDAS